MSTAGISTVDEALRYMRIPNQEELDRLECAFASSIKIGPFGRYGCRLWVKGDVIEFKLGSLPGGDEDFFITKNGLPFDPAEYGDLFILVRHRAAEVMQGVRAGHYEYNQRRKKSTRLE